jgi:tetratricopeptide (TPR) repeat protein
VCMLIRNSRCRRLLPFIVGAALSTLPAGAQDAGSAAQQHFAAAHQAQTAGDLDRAAQEYQAVIRLLPDVAEAYASLGLVYNAQGKSADAARALSKAEKLKPGLPGVSLYLGIAYEKQRQPSLAVPRLIEAVRLEPANKEAHTWLSRALWDDGRTPAALDQLRKASLLFPADPALLLDLGEAYRKAADLGIQHVLTAAAGTPLQHQVYGDIYKDEHKWENALAHYYRALDQDAHWQGAHYGVGEVAFHREKWDTAAQEYHRELEIDPGSAASLARLAEMAMLQGHVDEAVRLLGAAIHMSAFAASSALGLPRPYPAAGETLSEAAQTQLRINLTGLEASQPGPPRSLALAVANARLGNKEAFDAAWKEFTQAAALTNTPNLYARGLDNYQRQDFEQAANNLNAYLKLHPADLKADYLLARAYRDLSLSTLEQLLTLAPDSYPAHQLLAETYQNGDEDAKALEEYRIVETLAPNLPGVHFTIGHLLLKTGHSEEAKRELEAELAANPDHSAANAEMGTLLLNQQDSTKAIPLLKKALQADPDRWDTYRDLGKAYYMQKDFPRAETALQQAVRHDPEGLAHFQLALVYRSLGKKEAAAQQFEISRKLKLEGLAHAESQMTTLESLPQ